MTMSVIINDINDYQPNHCHHHRHCNMMMTMMRTTIKKKKDEINNIMAQHSAT